MFKLKSQEGEQKKVQFFMAGFLYAPCSVFSTAALKREPEPGGMIDSLGRLGPSLRGVRVAS